MPITLCVVLRIISMFYNTFPSSFFWNINVATIYVTHFKLYLCKDGKVDRFRSFWPKLNKASAHILLSNHFRIDCVHFLGLPDQFRLQRLAISLCYLLIYARHAIDFPYKILHTPSNVRFDRSLFLSRLFLNFLTLSLLAAVHTMPPPSSHRHRQHATTIIAADRNVCMLCKLN